MKPHIAQRLDLGFVHVKPSKWTSKRLRKAVRRILVLMQKEDALAKRVNRAVRRFTSCKRIGRPRKRFHLAAA